jgi:hypothetical protein
MPQPHFTLTISATVVAWYAAIVSTVSSAIQFANFLRDRPHVKLVVQKNMKILSDPRHPEEMIHTIVMAANAGRRPLTITAIGLLYLDNLGIAFLDTQPRLPTELTEGKRVHAYLNQGDLNFGKISHFYACDATGREFRLNIAPWHRRAYSRLRRRFARKKRKHDEGI